MKLIKPGGEHTIDLDLLPERPMILDVGCRDFQFDLEILKLRPEANILAFDPDPSIEAPQNKQIIFFQTAITHTAGARVKWQGPGEGSFIVDDKSGFGWPVHNPAKTAEVEAVSIPKIQETFKIEKFDLVKLDCEGSEFGIMENWPGPIATQISVEFHDFVNRSRWSDAYFTSLFAGPLRFYDLVLWKLTPLGPGNSMGHWDTLLVLK